jgi:hypothetical protein
VYTATCSTAGCTPVLSTSSVGTFENQLFTTVYQNVAGLPTPSSSPQNTSSPSTPFILAAQTTSPFNDEFVSGNTANMDTTVSIDLGSCTGILQTTACGVSGIDSIFTMLQASGAYGLQGMVLTVTGEDGNGNAVNATINLTSGVDYRSTRSNSTQTCDIANPSPSSPGTACTGTVGVNDTAQTSAVDSAPGGTLAGAKVMVYNNVFGALTNATTGRDFYFDVQQIGLGGLFLNGGVLDSISFENLSGATATQMVLNGVALSQVPEPSTFLLFGVSCGLVAFWRIRANRVKSAARK